jgi:ubiquinone/menaquinone biosynthesis C-methylase UbiE
MKNIILSLHTKLLRNTLGKTQRDNLVRYISPLLPDENIAVLDIGCGNGSFSHALMQAKPALHITGVETVARPECLITHRTYDGHTLPFPDKSFDYVMLINVLHHVDDQQQVLNEAKRVSRDGIIIKDHYANTEWDFFTLAMMERIGNAFWGISQPFNFLSEAGWDELFAKTGLKAEKLLTRFVSYNRFADFFIGRNLHFIAKCVETR